MAIKRFRSILILALTAGCIILSSAQSNKNFSLSAGLAMTYAPSLTWDQRNTQGAFISVFGDMQIHQSFIGRIHYSGLIPSSLTSEKSDHVQRGFSLNGSLGYNLTWQDAKLTVPIMVTLGMVQINYEGGGFDWVDIGMQAGATISPQYYLTDQVAATASIRYLKGIDIPNSGVVDQLDISLGIRYTFL